MKFSSELVYDRLGNALFRCLLDTGESIQRKTLTVEDYLSVIKGSTSSLTTYTTVGALPKHYHNGSISSDKPGCFKVMLTFPKEKRALSYAGSHFYVPFPALLFYFHYEDGVRKSAKVFALDTDTPSFDSKLFEYPFGNVNVDGGICFGNIKLPPVHSLSDTEALPQEFFLGVTQGDLYHRQNTANLSQGELLTFLQDKEEYPNELLKEHKITQKSLLN